MIKEKEVLVSVNSRNTSHYKKLEYNIELNENNELLVLCVHIPKNSKTIVTAICDICGKETKIMISKYWKNFDRGGFGFYSCFGCKNVKKEMTILKQYGVKSFSQTDEFKIKYKNTCIEKYGVENPNMLSEVREKTRKTCIEKYGVPTALNLTENLEKSKKWMSSDEFKMKSKKTLMQNYGVDSFSKTNEFKKIISEKSDQILEKMKITCLRNWGSEFYSKTDDWKFKYLLKLDQTKEKIKNTCLEKYGVENVSKVSEIYDRIIKSKIKNNLMVSDIELNDWELYKRKVRNETNKNKKILFEKWDGFDYYDNERIIGYLSYSPTHRFYPSIDHKISVLYGFQNGISIDTISSLENLCITKRYINSIKGKLIESQFNIL